MYGSSTAVTSGAMCDCVVMYLLYKPSIVDSLNRTIKLKPFVDLVLWYFVSHHVTLLWCLLCVDVVQ